MYIRNGRKGLAHGSALGGILTIIWVGCAVAVIVSFIMGVLTGEGESWEKVVIGKYNGEPVLGVQEVVSNNLRLVYPSNE